MYRRINGIDWQEIVESAVAEAFGICWDECHKIYICKDEIAFNSMRDDYGYTMQRLTEEVDGVELLWSWFSSGCGLEFINSIDKSDEIRNIVPQFYESETDWLDEEGGQV